MDIGRTPSWSICCDYHDRFRRPSALPRSSRNSGRQNDNARALAVHGQRPTIYQIRRLQRRTSPLSTVGACCLAFQSAVPQHERLRCKKLDPRIHNAKALGVSAMKIHYNSWAHASLCAQCEQCVKKMPGARSTGSEVEHETSKAFEGCYR